MATRTKCQLQLINNCLIHIRNSVNSQCSSNRSRYLCTSSQCQSAASSLVSEKEDFKIPNRIPRSSTDILKALASTVKRDPHGPHYTFHDDPYLTPISTNEKRSFALTKESGKQSARWILEKHPNLFVSKADEPSIPAFDPLEQYTEDSSVDEQTLLELLQSRRVEDAVKIYRLCSSKDIPISPSTLQSLLEFTCFYNENEPLSDEWQQEKFYESVHKPAYGVQNTWNAGGLAQELFDAQEQPSHESYCAMIRGMAKHGHVSHAWQLYNTAVAEDISIDLETLNSLTATILSVHSVFAKRFTALKDILADIASRGLRPNLNTLNSCLQVLSASSRHRDAKTMSLQLLKEMHLQGVRPSLASYYFLLLIHKNSESTASNNNILRSILDELEKEEGHFQPRDPRDIFFFRQAMNMARDMRCLKTGYRIHALLKQGQNDVLLVGSIMENNYYSALLSLAVSCSPIEEFMRLYNSLVPHVCGVGSYTMEEIVNEVVIQRAFQFLPTLWTDMIAMLMIFRSRDSCLNTILTAMAEYSPDDNDGNKGHKFTLRGGAAMDATLVNEFARDDLTLGHQFCKMISYIVLHMVQLVENPERHNNVEWNGVMCGQMLRVLTVCCEGQPQQLSAGADLLKVALSKTRILVLGEIPVENVQGLQEAALQCEHTDTALMCALYCNEFEQETAKVMARNVAAMNNLTAVQRAKLAITFGREILTVRPTEEATMATKSDNTDEQE